MINSNIFINFKVYNVGDTGLEPGQQNNCFNSDAFPGRP